jgi:hypothetical protein
VLNHRFAGNIDQDLSGQTGGSIPGGDDAIDFHNIFSPQRHREHRERIEIPISNITNPNKSKIQI